MKTNNLIRNMINSCYLQKYSSIYIYTYIVYNQAIYTICWKNIETNIILKKKKSKTIYILHR